MTRMRSRTGAIIYGGSHFYTRAEPRREGCTKPDGPVVTNKSTLRWNPEYGWDLKFKDGWLWKFQAYVGNC